jgi:hypothetical protein
MVPAGVGGFSLPQVARVRMPRQTTRYLECRAKRGVSVFQIWAPVRRCPVSREEPRVQTGQPPALTLAVVLEAPGLATALAPGLALALAPFVPVPALVLAPVEAPARAMVGVLALVKVLTEQVWFGAPVPAPLLASARSQRQDQSTVYQRIWVAVPVLKLGLAAVVVSAGA